MLYSKWTRQSSILVGIQFKFRIDSVNWIDNIDDVANIKKKKKKTLKKVNSRFHRRKTMKLVRRENKLTQWKYLKNID